MVQGTRGEREMEEAMKNRHNAKLELNKIANMCVLLTAKLPDVDEEEFRAAISTFDEKLKAWDKAGNDVEMPADEEEEQQDILEAASIYRDGVESCQLELLTEWKRTHPQNNKKMETPHPEQSVERMLKLSTSRTSAAAPYKPQQCAFYDGKLRSWVCRM